MPPHALLAVFTVFALGAASPSAEPPVTPIPIEPPTAPPIVESAKCKDASELYKPCDQAFKRACAERNGKFACTNADCSEGMCSDITA